MSRQISRAEAWEKTYEAFQQVNFSAFDYNTVKQSLIDYIRFYFPEQFNDFIESSEMISIIESFAYISELYAYRIDMNTHENFISTAQRKQSILRLAKLVSYSASRNMPGRGLVKITSVQTTESIIDSRSINLANSRVSWNDPNNSDWKEQFILIMNAILQQPFGSVTPSDRVQVDDVLFELYKLNNSPFANGVIPYTTQVNGKSVPMELVPSSLNNYGPYERRPEVNSTFSILYGSDGVGNASDTTGFFIFTKQGTLQRRRFTYDGITPNQTTTIEEENINNTDVWINNVNPETGQIIQNVVFDKQNRAVGVSGEWEPVNLTSASNILFNTNTIRNKYEIETLENDTIRIIFGDGDFSEIPSGSFDVWFRTSINDNIIIPRASVVNRSSIIRYRDANNTAQTLTITYSLINSITNIAVSEDIESIRRNAPLVYYTQDRMVNDQDYNTYVLQDVSVLKLRSFNRTYAGDSKYLAWHDPSSFYEDVKMFGNDATIFYNPSLLSINIPDTTSIDRVISSYIEPLLTDSGITIFHAQYDLDPPKRNFTAGEKEHIKAMIEDTEEAGVGFPLKLIYVPPTHHASQGVDYDDQIESGDSLIKHIHAQIGNPYNLTATIQITDSEGTNTVNLTYMLDVVNELDGFFRVVDSNPSGDLLTTYQEFIDDILLNQFEDSSDLVGERMTITIENGNIIFKVKEINAATSISIIDTSLFKYMTIVGGTPTNPAVTSAINGVTASTWKAYTDQTLLPNSISNTFYVELTGIEWDVTYNTLNLVCESATTRFWFADSQQKLSGNTQQVNYDELVLLAANINRDRTGIMGINTKLNVVGGVNLSAFPNSGLPDISKLALITKDDTGRVDTAECLLETIIDAQYVYPDAVDNEMVTLPETHSYLKGYDELKIYCKSTDSYLIKDLDYEENGIDETPTTTVTINGIYIADDLIFIKLDYVYLHRADETSEWLIIPATEDNKNAWYDNRVLYTRNRGRYDLNFYWKHVSPRFNLIDPATTNIIDMYVISRGYYTEFTNWLYNAGVKPNPPTALQLKVDYGYLLQNKMISDTVVLHPGNFKIIFGPKSLPQLQAKIKVVKDPNTRLTDNEIKTQIVDIIRSFFDVTGWEFGETFNFTELTAVIHSEMIGDVKSVVLVPLYNNHYFGDLYQVFVKEDEIVQADISVSDVEIVQYLSPYTLKQI